MASLSINRNVARRCQRSVLGILAAVLALGLPAAAFAQFAPLQRPADKRTAEKRAAEYRAAEKRAAEIRAAANRQSAPASAPTPAQPKRSESPIAPPLAQQSNIPVLAFELQQPLIEAYWTEPDVVEEFGLINQVDPALDQVVIAAAHQLPVLPPPPPEPPANAAQGEATPPAPPAPQPAPEGPALNSPEGLPPPAGESAAPADPNANLSTAERIGQAPEDTSLYFLRRQTILLEPGQHQVDVGFSYTLAEDDLPIALVDGSGDVTGVARGRLRQRLLLFPIELRYGLFERMQMYLNLPLGGAGTELAFAGVDEHDTKIGIGDIRLGSTFLVHKGEHYSPDFITTLDFTFPTGDAEFPLITATPESRFGEGYFALAVNCLWVQTLDPVVLYYGVGYRHRFEREFDGILVTPGEQFLYQLGVGFAVNEYVTLSASFLGFYISETYLDEDRVEGSALEPMRMRFATTIVRPQERVFPAFVGVHKVREIVEPFAEVGMTDDGPSARFGITWTY